MWVRVEVPKPDRIFTRLQQNKKRDTVTCLCCPFTHACTYGVLISESSLFTPHSDKVFFGKEFLRS